MVRDVQPVPDRYEIFVQGTQNCGGVVGMLFYETDKVMHACIYFMRY